MKSRAYITGAAVILALTSAGGVLADDKSAGGYANWAEHITPASGPTVSSLSGYSFGSASDARAAVDKTIKLDGSTSSVNVMRGETVALVNVANGKQFAWKFDTVGAFDLARIAPKDFGTGHTRVYVGPSPYENAD